VKRPDETIGPANTAAPNSAAMPIYVISLNRAPERRAHMIASRTLRRNFGILHGLPRMYQA
jgi:hypothetical protein